MRVAVLFSALALTLSSCGGQTGVELLIDPPIAYVAGQDFTHVRVQVDYTRDDGTVGDEYPINEQRTPRPYRVYVWPRSDDDVSVRITVELKKNGAPTSAGNRIVPVDFKDGEIIEQTVAF